MNKARLVEYNIINNIPVLYPKENFLRFDLCPRHTIADSEIIMKCFDNKKLKQITIGMKKFYYQRVEIPKTYKILDDKVRSLFCYMIIDSNSNYDVYFNYFDLSNWIKNNHHIMITTPLFVFDDKTYYTISNDNDLKIIFFEDEECDDDVLKKMLEHQCYTLCDNFNIIISLFHQNLIKKECFIMLINELNDLKYQYYTEYHWIFYQNHHRILNACDVPLIHLSQKPHLIDFEILREFEWIIYNDEFKKIFLQTSYKNNLLYTTPISHSLLDLNTYYLKLLNQQDLLYYFCLKDVKCEHLIELNYEIDFVISDLFGFFVAVGHKNSMWKLWNTKVNTFVTKLLETHYVVFDLTYYVFYPLFRLYKYGYDGKNIRKNRIHKIWQDILKCLTQKKVEDLLKILLVCDKIEVPYIFLIDIYTTYDFDFFKYENFLMKENKIMIFKRTHLYECFQRNNDVFVNFHNRVLKKKLIEIIMCIYRKFDMFSNSPNTNKCHIGEIIINFMFQK